MLSFVNVGGGYSIAMLDLDEDVIELMWWCGENHEWVSPHSSHWHTLWDCENVIFPTLGAAEAFARSMKWEVD